MLIQRFQAGLEQRNHEQGMENAGLAKNPPARHLEGVLAGFYAARRVCLWLDIPTTQDAPEGLRGVWQSAGNGAIRARAIHKQLLIQPQAAGIQTEGSPPRGPASAQGSEMKAKRPKRIALLGSVCFRGLAHRTKEKAPPE